MTEIISNCYAGWLKSKTKGKLGMYKRKLNILHLYSFMQHFGKSVSNQPLSN